MVNAAISKASVFAYLFASTAMLIVSWGALTVDWDNYNWLQARLCDSVFLHQAFCVIYAINCIRACENVLECKKAHHNDRIVKHFCVFCQIVAVLSK